MSTTARVDQGDETSCHAGDMKIKNFGTVELKSVVWQGMFRDLFVASEKTCYMEYEQQIVVVITAGVEKFVEKSA